MLTSSSFSRSSLWLVLGLSMARASAAFATSDPSATISSAPPSSSAGVSDDPNLDRSFLLPTAMTQPKGTLTYNNYELLFHGLSYGLTDRLQLTATVLSPISKDIPFVGFAALKGQVVNGERVKIAGQASVGYIHVFDDNSSTSNNNAFFVSGAALGSFCVQEGCHSLLSATVSLMQPLGQGADSTPIFYYGVSAIQRVGRHVKLLAEVASAAGNNSGDFENADGFLVNYGVRFHNQSIASDVGFMRPFATSGDAPDFILGVPFVNVSYRW